jgi:hypothetical protein
MNKLNKLANNLIKQIRPKDCNGKVLKNDIVSFMGSYCFILQTKNHHNNLCIFKYSQSDYPLNIPMIMFFLRKCYTQYGIEFIRVNGKDKRYKYLCRHYDGLSSDNGDTYYFNLNNVLRSYYA